MLSIELDPEAWNSEGLIFTEWNLNIYLERNPFRKTHEWQADLPRVTHRPGKAFLERISGLASDT